MKKFLMIFLTVCMVVSCMIVPSFAADWPSSKVEEVEAQGYFYVIEKVGDGYWLWYTDSPECVYWSAQHGHGFITGDAVTYGVYTWSGNWTKPWTSLTFYENESVNEVSFVNSDPVYSSFDIYWEDGSLFFPPAVPLAETVEELTMDQAMKVQNQTVGVMKILVPCGVGCLALLMALPTLRKGFLRFLH